MLTTSQFLLLFIGLGVLFIVVGLPFAMNLVKPNHLSGVRVRKTLSNERVWYLANSYWGKRSIILGVVTVVLAIVLRLISMPPATYGLICGITLFFGLILTSILTLIYVKRI